MDPKQDNRPPVDHSTIPPEILAIFRREDSEKLAREAVDRQKRTRFAVLTASDRFWPSAGQSVDLTADFGPKHPNIPLKLVHEGGHLFLTGALPDGRTPVSLVQVWTELETSNPFRLEMGPQGRSWGNVTVPPPPRPEFEDYEPKMRGANEVSVALGAACAPDAAVDAYPKPKIDAAGTLHVEGIPDVSDEVSVEVLAAEVRGLDAPVPFLAQNQGHHQLAAEVPGFRDQLVGKQRIDLRIRPLSPGDWPFLDSPLTNFALANQQVESWTFASDSQPGRARVFLPPQAEADTTYDAPTTWLLGYTPETQLPKGDR
jgi:hypothetical protein